MGGIGMGGKFLTWVRIHLPPPQFISKAHRVKEQTDGEETEIWDEVGRSFLKNKQSDRRKQEQI
jgi:hypothetical protein